MKNDKHYSYLTTLLGFVIGMLLTIVIYKSGLLDRSKNRVPADYGNWQKLNLILHEVQKNYVDTVDIKSVTDAAVEAALSKLDPHSIYLPPADLEQAETELAGNFDGIGIQFNVPNDTAVVLEVIPGGPSELVGLQTGDRIIKVDSAVIAGVKCPQDSMVRKMKGKAGTKVQIHVLRDGEQIAFDITRGKIPLHSVDAHFMVGGSTGYIRLSKFSKTTFQEVTKAMAELQEQGMKKLIFDLRDNTGGYMDQALLLANMFLEKDEEVVYIQGLHRAKKEYKADGKGIAKDVNLTVLINEGSASSSEIFAGAIQDNDRGRIIGRRSYGKGLVQEPIFFTDGSGVRITVARFYTPSGRCIQKPYSDDYQYDFFKRYKDGELFTKDSIKVNTDEVYYTKSGREVYGGGGIIPDIFVPMDTTKASQFYIKCNKKATQMRFASYIFDKHKSELRQIDNYGSLEKFFSRINVADSFIRYASAKDGITLQPGEWQETKAYMMPQIKALIARYSLLGENAFFRMYAEIDDVFQTALKSVNEESWTE